MYDSTVRIKKGNCVLNYYFQLINKNLKTVLVCADESL